MSEMNEYLKRQLMERQEPLLRRFLEQKPGYVGPTLAPADEDKIKAEERVRALEERLRAASNEK